MTKLMFKLPVATLALALGIAGANPALAQTTVASQSFESPTFTTPGVQYGPDQFVAHNQNAVGPVIIPNFTFNGYSGVIANGFQGVFNNTPAGNQAAFLQAYTEPNGTFGGSSITWTIPGLINGRTYQLSFLSAGSLVVSTAPVTVGGAGLTTTIFNPGQSFTASTLAFTATGNTITFSTPAGPGNVATALDALAVTAVPEPATWAMMLLGVGMVGVGLRRRGAARPAIA